MKNTPPMFVVGLQSLGRVARSMWRWLPEVRPYTGPASLTAKPGQTLRILNGRVVVTSAPK